MKLKDILLELLDEQQDDRCLRIARRKYDKPSAYRSGAIVQCRKGKIWKGLKEENMQKNSNIESFFESHPELSSIGSLEQYYNYLKTIFPNSKVKNFVYHSSSNEIEKFRNTMFGTYFSYSPIKDVYGKNIIIALINVKNPLIKPKPTDSEEVKIIYDKEFRNYNNPSSQYDSSIEGSTVTDEGIQIRVKDPNQIHILGSKEDLEKFKNYTKSLNEDESLHKWFSRKGAGGKSKGWVDCNTCKEDPKTGRKKCKSCGRQKGENRAKYPSCRPTPSRCGDPGKGKKWGKTNEDYNEPSLITEITDNQILFFITKPNGKFGLVPFDRGFSNSYKKNTGAKMTTNFVNSINEFIKKLNPNSSMKAVLDNIYGTVRFVNIK
jgi:hypothetical protein